jgi:Mg-chelatase subunit ChlD
VSARREDLSPLERWRLVLGEPAEDALGGGAAVAPHDAALSFLYDREEELVGRGVRTGDRTGARDPARPTVPEWLDAIHALFPKETVERLERDAVERYGLEEIVTDPEVLERVEPSRALLRAVLRTKHLMDPQLLNAARRLVARVVQQLLEALRREVRVAFSGTLDRRRASPRKVARNLDLARTLRRNLKHYDPERRRVLIERPHFFARTARHGERWQVILLVDQSASMLDSAIHGAVTAACFWGVPGLKTHLLTFSTEVVDLTRDVTDPVELLLKVQLGGGTDIARALAYAAGLIENPRRTVVVLITDFYEGGDPEALVRRVRALSESGVRVLGLAALDAQANPDYDRELARRCVEAGAQVGAMTPGQLAAFVAETVGR